LKHTRCKSTKTSVNKTCQTIDRRHYLTVLGIDLPPTEYINIITHCFSFTTKLSFVFISLLVTNGFDKSNLFITSKPSSLMSTLCLLFLGRSWTEPKVFHFFIMSINHKNHFQRIIPQREYLLTIICKALKFNYTINLKNIYL
jgi:hypothetical protein